MTMVTCTRPSTLSGALDDKGGLIPYAASTALMTIATNPDLLTRLSLLGKTDETGHWKAYKDIYNEADKRGGGREASEGTNIHSVVQALALGADVAGIPEPTLSDGLAVWRTLHAEGIEIVASEQFVYSAGLPEHCAGPLDLAGNIPNGRYIVIDTKSVGEAKDPKYNAMKWSMQTAIYALGKPYDHPYKRDQWGRPVIDTDLVGEWPFGSLDQEVALILQVVRGSAKVTPIRVNLDYGREWARLACRVRAEKKKVADALDVGVHPQRALLTAELTAGHTSLGALLDGIQNAGCR